MAYTPDYNEEDIVNGTFDLISGGLIALSGLIAVVMLGVVIIIVKRAWR